MDLRGKHTLRISDYNVNPDYFNQNKYKVVKKVHNVVKIGSMIFFIGLIFLIICITLHPCV